MKIKNIERFAYLYEWVLDGIKRSLLEIAIMLMFFIIAAVVGVGSLLVLFTRYPFPGENMLQNLQYLIAMGVPTACFVYLLVIGAHEKIASSIIEKYF